jgi:hypothetical protein
MTFRDDIAHIRTERGEVFQVLNAAEDDWDETATRALYDASLAAISGTGAAVVVDLGV